MIIKASQRGGGQNLATHLMRTDENEHVELHELRGFASLTLRGALKEAEAISLGTRCRQYLFSVSFSPPDTAQVSVGIFENAINEAEKRLGLLGQPRAIVFHEKEGRRHAHCVWSRVDTETMTARQMSFFKSKLTNLSRELYLQHDWQMPHGLIASGERNPTNFTLAEWQQAKRLQQDPRWIRQIIGDCWVRSDSKAAFERGLGEHALMLARGDRRGFVVVDHAGEVHSLSRCLGKKAKELSERLGDPDKLGGVEEAKKSIAGRLAPAMQRHIADAQVSFQKHKAKLELARADMVQRQRDERAKMIARQRQQFEKDTRERAARLPKGLRGLWHRITGKYQEVRRQNETEAENARLRQNAERENLIERQLDQRRALQTEIKESRRTQAERLRELRREVGRFLTFSGARDATANRALGSPLKLQR